MQSNMHGTNSILSLAGGFNPSENFSQVESFPQARVKRKNI